MKYNIYAWSTKCMHKKSGVAWDKKPGGTGEKRANLLDTLSTCGVPPSYSRAVVPPDPQTFFPGGPCPLKLRHYTRMRINCWMTESFNTSDTFLSSELSFWELLWLRQWVNLKLIEATLEMNKKETTLLAERVIIDFS